MIGESTGRTSVSRVRPTRIRTQADIKRWYRMYQLMEHVSRCNSYKEVFEAAVEYVSPSKVAIGQSRK